MTDKHPDSTLATAAEAFARRLWEFAYAAGRRGADWISDLGYADEQARRLDELERSGELEALIEVTGATREQLRSAELSPLAAFELLDRMMQRLGIDTGKARHHVSVTAEAQWHCRLCKSWRECRHWVDRDVVDERYRDFCSNAELLDRLQTALANPPSSRREA